ncbi:zinc finger protein ZFP2-like isoform X2 [Littorina saxatilis]|uniref:zinc finger protein ZFP2-like isoform X2 n=1 Tax=Littorina saxatilis TaxID=31220 RepID=UPI0038B460AA
MAAESSLASVNTEMMLEEPLKQIAEEKYHHMTAALVQELLALPDIHFVHLTGHMGVTINGSITFIISPHPSAPPGESTSTTTSDASAGLEIQVDNASSLPIKKEANQSECHCRNSASIQTENLDSVEIKPNTGEGDVVGHCTNADFANTLAKEILHKVQSSEKAVQVTEKQRPRASQKRSPRKRGRPRKVVSATASEDTAPVSFYVQENENQDAEADAREDEAAEEAEEESNTEQTQEEEGLTEDGTERQCPVCNKKFPAEKRAGFKRHVKSHAQRVQCKTCGKWLSSPDALKNHQRGLHGTEKPFSCEECGMMFGFYHSYKLHRLKHSGARPHSCPHCAKSYLTVSHMKAHIDRAHVGSGGRGGRGAANYQCETCGRAFTSATGLKMHSFRHSNNKPFHCTVCSKGFPSKSSLFAHSKTVHTSERNFQCDVCHKFFKSEQILKMHQRRHDPKQNARYVCDVCGRQFHFQSSLKAHATVHEDTIPFSCEVCGKGFKLLASLYSHRYTHSTETPYQCSICPKTFKCKSQCLVHEQRHTATKSFICETCNATFPDKGGLDKHTRTIHSPTKVFQCTICGKTGTRKDNMRTHIKSHGRDWSTEQVNACIKQFSN